MKLVLAEGRMLNFYLKNKDSSVSTYSKRNLKKKKKKKIRVPSVSILVTVGSLSKISCLKTKHDSKENRNAAESMI